MAKGSTVCLTDCRVHPVGGNPRAKTPDGMAQDGMAGQIAEFQGIHHGHMGAEISAPAHAHSCKYGDIVALGQASFHQTRHQADGRSRGAKGCNCLLYTS